MNIRKMPTIPTLPKKKQVAAYARVSSGKDAMLHSLSAQISYYSEYIQKQPEWLYCGVYVDEVVTGTKSERPEFQRQLSDCRAGKIDMVIHSPSSVFAGIGENLMLGLWNGISDSVGWILDKVRDFGGTLIDMVKSVFGISSPSKVFADEIGKNLGLGVGVGFEDAMRDVSKDMRTRSRQTSTYPPTCAVRRRLCPVPAAA